MTAEVCAHRWSISEPQGRVSWGYCQLCGQAREFANFVYRTAWSTGSRPSRVVAAELSEIVRQYGGGSDYRSPT